MTEDHDADPYCADPPRDSRSPPSFLDALKNPNYPATVKVVQAFCVECQRVLAMEEMKCHNCTVNKPTGIQENKS